MRTLAALPALAAFVAGLAFAQAPDPDRRLEKTVVVKAPLDEAWKAWTTSEGIRTFFAPDARIEARPGGAFEIFFNPYAKPGLKGADGMQVLAVQEKKLVSFTWNSPPYMPEVRGQMTSVQVRFRPVSDTETEVRLVHGGWGEGPKWDESFDYFDKAWAGVLEAMRKRFVEGPRDFAPFLKRLKEQADAEAARK